MIDNSTSKKHLRAVNPKARSNTPKEPESPPPKTNEVPQPEKKKSYTGWLIFGSIVVVLGAVSQIPISPTVRADAWLEPDPEARQVVHMEVPGKITEVLVKPNQNIEPGDAIALLETEQLETEIVEWDLRVQESLSGVENANQQVSNAQAKIRQTRVNEQQIQNRVTELQQEIELMEAGSFPPHLQAIEQEMTTLNKTVASLDQTINRYQNLVKEGAVSYEQVNERERQKLNVLRQISDKQAEIETHKRQLYEQLQNKQEELNHLQTSTVVAQQELATAQTQIKTQAPILQKVKQQRDKKNELQANSQVIRATQEGKIISQNLYALEGKTLEPGEPILEIAQPQQLVAVIEVRQEEADLIKEGAIVTFNPLEPGYESFTTDIEEIIDVLEVDEQLKKSTLQVIAQVETKGSELKPGAKVFAKIKSPQQIRLYQKVWREFLNLFKIRKYS
ncbi:MAG: efflux RND transporter periplasmic adaptor subunit [Spirulinaceae cyanobacterium]